jgi:hypothetical protein
MSAAPKVPPAACSVDAHAAELPSAMERALVALLALAALLWPYLWDRQTDSKDAVGNALVHDGLRIVTGNEVLSSIPEAPGKLFETLGSSWWGRSDPGQALYRPLSSFVLGLGSLLAGERYNPDQPGLGAVPFKLLCISLKVLTALLVVELATRVLRRRRYALIAGLLFATLPVHGEVLFDVVGVAELLATVFSLGALILWVRAGNKPFEQKGLLLGAAGLTLLASLSKESAFALPLVFFALDFALPKEGGFGAGLRAALAKLPAQGLIVALLLLSLGLRYVVLGTLSPSYPPETELANPLVFAAADTRIANAARVLVSSLPLLVGINRLSGNWNFSADYSNAQIPVLPSTALPNLIALAVLLLLVLAPVLLYKRCRTRAALFLALLAATLLTSNLLFPIGTIFGERLLFFPSVFAVLFLAPFLGALGRAGLGLALALALGGGYWTIARASTWSDQWSLWSYTAAKSSPNSALAHFNLGVAQTRREQRLFAELSFEKAANKYPEYAESWVALATVRGDDPAEATLALKRAVELKVEQSGGVYTPETTLALTGVPALLEGLTNLMAIKPRLDPEGHLEWLQGLFDRGYRSPHLLLRKAETLRALNQSAQAEEAYQQSLAIEVTPSTVGSYGRFLRLMGRNEEAAALFQKHLEIVVGADQDSDSNRLLKQEYLLARGDAELSGQTAQALATAEEVLALLPEGEVLLRALLLRSQAQLDLPASDSVEMAKRLSSVISDLRRGLAAFPYDTPESRASAVILARLLPSQGNKEAISLLTGLVSTMQEAPTLRLALGQVLLREGRFAEAATQFELSAAGLLRKAGDSSSDEIYIQARTLELFALDAVGDDASRSTLVSRLDAETARATAPADVVRANYFAAKGDFPGARAALEALARHLPSPGQAQPFAARINRLEQLAQAATPDAMQLAEQASLRLSILDRRGATELAQKAADAASAGPAELRAEIARLQADCLEASAGPEAALAPLKAALELPELSAPQQANLKQAIARLSALLGKS